MRNFESLLQEIRNLAKSVTNEEFCQDLKEYHERYNKKDEDIMLPLNKYDNYTINSQYFSVDTCNVFTDDTYAKVG